MQQSVRKGVSVVSVLLSQPQLRWWHDRTVCPAAVGAAVPARAEAVMHTGSGWQMQPSKTWAAGKTWGFSPMPAVLQDVCHRGGAVLRSGGVTGGSEQAVQHQRG